MCLHLVEHQITCAKKQVWFSNSELLIYIKIVVSYIYMYQKMAANNYMYLSSLVLMGTVELTAECRVSF